MPVQFLTRAERERLQSFPDEITFNELITFFTLSQKDGYCFRDLQQISDE